MLMQLNRYHRFPWYATFEMKTPTEMFPKFPSIIRRMFARQITISHKRSPLGHGSLLAINIFLQIKPSRS